MISNASNPEGFEFAFTCFESLSNGSNLDSNALNPVWMVWICIRIVLIFIRSFKFAFESFEFAFAQSLSNGSNLHSNASKGIQMLRITFECLQFHFQCFESVSKGSNLHSNASNPFRKFRLCIRMLRILSNGSNLHSNASNSIWIWDSNASNPLNGSNIH